MMKLPAIVLVSIALLTAACTAQEEVGDEEASSDAITGVSGELSSGAKVVTTARLNLRAGASMDDDILLTMPRGASLTVLSSAPVEGFYNVDYEGQHGWASGRYLSATDPRAEDAGGPDSTAGDSCYDASMGAKLVRTSLDVDGDRSQGLCYRYVKNHIEEAGTPIRNFIPDDSEASAYMFAVWGKRDPAGLAAAGFARSSASLDALPAGAIIVWRAGQCGYSAEHGHIEINIGGGRACSDFCGRIRRDCGSPDVFVPIRSGCR